jgi:hypothetical protein
MGEGAINLAKGVALFIYCQGGISLLTQLYKHK